MVLMGNTPLWPAGHLPLKGGDFAVWPKLPISLFEGEMAGRPEGGSEGRTATPTVPHA